MDVALSAEQQMLAQTAADIAEDIAAGWNPGKGPATYPGAAPPEGAWRKIAAAGLLTLAVSEDRDGGGGGALEAALCVEQFARFAAPAPLLGTLIVINQLVTRDAEPSVCQEIFDGDAIWAATVTRDLTALAQTPDSAWAVDCASAEGAAVFEPERLVVCGIETMPWADLSRGFGRVETSAIAHEVRLPVAAPAETTARSIAFAMILTSADLLGAMQGSFDQSLAHSRLRQQFGRPVAEFQAIQHIAAECHVSIEAARSAVWYSAWAFDNRPIAEAVQAARVAKAFLSASAVEVAEAAIQMVGGLGMTWEYPAHVWLRRARASRALFGSEHVQYSHLDASAVGAPSTAGVARGL